MHEPNANKRRHEQEAWYDFLKKDYVQGFPAHCGFEVVRAADGEFDTRLVIQPYHVQQDGFVHAGVMATMADHTAGYAAYTTVTASSRILTIEFKINFLKPALGDALLCRSNVISRGRRIIVAGSEVFALNTYGEKQVAQAMVTLTAVAVEKLQRS